MMIYWIIAISLLFSAFFSGMEIAFLSSNKLRFELDKKRKNVTSSIISLFYNNSEQFLATLLVGNNIALVIYGIEMATLLSPLLRLFMDNDFAVNILQTLIATLIVLFTGEFLPKTIFRVNPNVWLTIFSPLLWLCYVLLYPIARFATFLSVKILQLFKVKVVDKGEKQELGKVDLDFWVNDSFEHADNQEEVENEVKIFQNALDFSEVKLRDCIVPRTEIVSLSHNSSLEELRNTFIETGFSKIPIYKDNGDNIIGYFHSSDLFKQPEDWHAYVRPITIVPETMAANKLMKIFMQDKRSIALVVDEFGGTAGIVTLEDIMEEIFGEIEDEHDSKEYVAKQLADNEYVLSGRLEIDNVNLLFDLNIPESDNYVTVAGFILHHYEQFPKLNDTIRISNWTFKILQAHNNRINLVKLTIHEG
ncbi:MAG: HlyC/CorC family transporter [Paludibacteraceae bacterium]|nr:HlyC/CorC family transporter [Paludibacteraceae bacterium]